MRSFDGQVNRLSRFLMAFALSWFSGAGCLAELPVSSFQLRWSYLESLPNTVGLGGAFAGTHNGALIVAGGANFPNGPPWAAIPGEKVWHDDIYVLTEPNGHWERHGRLPQRLAYGATVSIADGVVLIGGEEDGIPVANVYRLRWQIDPPHVSIESLPSLPKSSAFPSAGLIGNKLYVLASHRSPGADQLDSKAFWALDLGGEASQREWRSLPHWPGPARHKAVAAVQENSLYFFSGENPRYKPSGEADLTRFQYFTDAYRYDAEEQQWSRLTNLPVTPAPHSDRDAGSAGPTPIAAGTAISVANDPRILLFGGVTGWHVTSPPGQHPPLSQMVHCYDTRDDFWSRVETPLPLGVVTTTAVCWHERIVIPSGETRPGIRTPRVQQAKILPSTATRQRRMSTAQDTK